MTQRSYRHWIATALSHALMADAQTPAGRAAAALQARAARCLGANPAWLKPLIDAIARDCGSAWQQHSVATLAAHIDGLKEFDGAFDSEAGPPRVRRLLLRPARMAAPPFQLQGLDLPSLPTLADLAAWLEVTPERLQWFVGPARDFREEAAFARAGPFIPASHYHQSLKPKNSGGLRLIESPKADLKRIQRQLLAGLLDKVPVHESAHGFVKGRGVVTHAHEHAGRAVVVAHDLREFFNSIGRARVKAVWRTLGYPEGVAAALAALCTTRTPRAVRERMLDSDSIDRLGASRLASPHLPQGAPTSPALANLCAFGLDLRLDGLAWRFGALYTRYADDLVFSGAEQLMRDRRSLQAWAEAIARAEGFLLHAGKARAMPQHARQQVTGVVVNARPNLERGAYDLLRAQLHHCARGSGCDAGTRQRLQGQVAWASQLVCPSRAEKLRKLLAAIPA